MDKVREITLKDIEAALKEVAKTNEFYSKDLGNGLYEIGPGCISGRRGLELLDEEIRKTVQDPNFKLRGVPVVDTDKVVLPNGMNITFNNKEDE